MEKLETLTRDNWKSAVTSALDEFPDDLREKLTSREWGRDHIGIKVKVPDPTGAERPVPLAVDVRYQCGAIPTETSHPDAPDTAEEPTATTCVEVTNQSDAGRLATPVGRSTVGELMDAVQRKIHEEMMVGGLITRHHDSHYMRFDGGAVCQEGPVCQEEPG